MTAFVFLYLPAALMLVEVLRDADRSTAFRRIRASLARVCLAVMVGITVAASALELWSGWRDPHRAMAPVWEIWGPLVFIVGFLGLGTATLALLSLYIERRLGRLRRQRERRELP